MTSTAPTPGAWTTSTSTPATSGQLMAAVTIVIIACCREYTGYMALHIADTGPPGAAWAFTPEWRLQQVTPGQLKACCGIANKMCYWLGCPMVSDSSTEVTLARPGLQQTRAESGDQVTETGTGLITDR